MSRRMAAELETRLEKESLLAASLWTWLAAAGQRFPRHWIVWPAISRQDAVD